MKKIVPHIIRHRMTVVMLCIIVVVVGLYSYYIIPKQENPDTAVAAATITTIYPGASPEEVELNVTNVIEEQIAFLPHLDYYESQSLNNVSVIVLMFDLDVTIEDVEADLRQSVEDLQLQLPELAQESVIDANLVGENQFIISLSGGDYSNEELSLHAELVKDRIDDVAGIESVVVEGRFTEQVVIQTRLADMQSYGIRTETLLQILQSQNLALPSGGITDENGTVNVILPSFFNDLQDIEDIVVGVDQATFVPITLSDVADVYIEEVKDFYFSQDGDDAILLTGTIEEGQNAVNIGNELREAIEDARESVPDDIVFHEVMYAPQDIENSINNFILNLLQSILLIVVVVMVGVHLRNGLIVSIALPLSILSTFIVMNLLSLEFHFITIAGLIVSLGILVDNAIVISEAIQHHLNQGTEKVKAITRAVGETAVPVLTSTLTTIVTFSIIYFIPGPVGQVAGTIPTVVISALVASYFVAMFVIPVLAYWFFKPEPEKVKNKRNPVGMIFQAMLGFALKHRVTTVISAFITLGIAALLAMQLGMQFFPVADKPIVYINYESDVVTTEASQQVSLDIGELLDTQPVVENYTYAVGNDLPSFFLTVPALSGSVNIGQFMLQLDEEEMDNLGGVEATAMYIQELLDDELDGASATVKSLEYSIPTDAKIAFKVSGKNVEDIERITSELKDALNEIAGTDRVQTTQINYQDQYVLELDDDELAEHGLLKSDVVNQVKLALLNTDVGVYGADNNSLDIVLKGDISSVNNLEDLQIVSNITGASVELDNIAEVTLEPAISLITHYDGEYYLNVLSNVLPGYSSIEIESELYDRYIDAMNLEGVTITGQGEVNNMLGLLTALAVSAVLAVLLIYLILIFQFNGLKKPLIVLASIPLSFIGCGFGLWIFKMDIQAMALLGLVSLFGIVVNNSILLIEAMDAKIKAGESIEQACKSAVALRFRPIILSSTTTCIGLVPLIVSADPMTAPMASVLLFGLLFSTVLTMVVVPTLYAIQAQRAHSKGRQHN